ncbi:MAG: NAD(P)H-dependent glycerol-3-phosphate dehydrogenase [Clostridiales bacterium]
MQISVIGCGRWGSFIAWYLDRIGHDVSLYGRADSKHIREFKENRTNGMITLSPSTKLITDLKEALKAQYIVVSINAQGVRDLMGELGKFNPKDKTFILCMKGVEISTGERLSQVVTELSDVSCKVAVWLGPGHVQEFYRGVPNCMVIDSDDEATKALLVKEFSGDLIRFYYGNDLLGNEIGAAAKNVIGIAAGMLDGKGLPSLKGALMSRGTREIARLIRGMGGNELSAYGLCHLGDYEATVFSKFSHNRQFGEAFVKNEKFSSLAEGYYTVRALTALGEKYNVDLPICHAVQSMLYHKADADTTLKELFLRSIKKEF